MSDRTQIDVPAYQDVLETGSDVQTKTYWLEGGEPIPVEGIAEGGLNGASHNLPHGAYTTFRTYRRDRVLCLDVHLDRLESSARLLGSRETLDRESLCRAIAEIIALHRYPESRLRVTWAVPSGTLYGTISLFTPLAPEVYRFGVRCITCTMQRERPRAKDTKFISPSRQLKRMLSADVFEVIMCTPAGEMLEGLTSNFFAVRDGVLFTAGDRVLEGVTRRILLTIAPRFLTVRLTPIRRQHLVDVTEAFITSSSRELVPVVKIDDQVIGNGKPGVITQRLLRRYRAFVRRMALPVGSGGDKETGSDTTRNT